jgi:hypothetical protein
MEQAVVASVAGAIVGALATHFAWHRKYARQRSDAAADSRLALLRAEAAPLLEFLGAVAGGVKIAAGRSGGGFAIPDGLELLSRSSRLGSLLDPPARVRLDTLCRALCDIDNCRDRDRTLERVQELQSFTHSLIG